MPQRNPHPRRTAGVLLSLCSLVLLGACEFLTGVNEPDDLDLTIESSDVDEAVLVLSTYFLQIPDPECPDECERLVELVESDTMTVSLPHAQIYPFTSRQQYFVEAWPAGESTATLSMGISIDGRVWYDDFRELLSSDEDGEQETLRFVYSFNELGL